VTEPTFTDLEQYTKDIRTLSKKLAIRTIRLMGGEPLLHPRVNDFMRVTREAYPHSKIFIVTNGLLLLKMLNDFWETLRHIVFAFIGRNIRH
jgi:ABC-2 type transport system ATP-binding protein